MKQPVKPTLLSVVRCMTSVAGSAPVLSLAVYHYCLLQSTNHVPFSVPILPLATILSLQPCIGHLS